MSVTAFLPLSPTLTDELIDFVALPRLSAALPHSLQSGSDEVLSAMRRRYRTELYAANQRIRNQMPHASIGVDVIVGFPGERTVFRNIGFHQVLDISYLHVFTYSERPNNSLAN